MPATTSRTGWSYRPELDGLRTLAVVAVIFFHARVGGFGGAFIGLDLFFVLSGFLVANVVLSDLDERGRVDFGRFYARRVRRLLPAAAVAVVGICVIFLLISSEPQRLAFVKQGQAALVYLANWQFIAEANDYFVDDATASPFMHFWSLSVEEQYYVFFPLLIWLVHRFAPGKGRVLLGVFGGLIALSVTSQLVSANTDPIRAYYATDARLYQLLAGAAMAVAFRELTTPRTRSAAVRRQRLGRTLATAGLIGFVLLASDLLPMPNTARNLVATLVSLALIGGLYTSSGSLLTRLFSRPTPVYLGKISYGTYLWHWPMILLIGEVMDIRPLAVALLAGLVATALASLSYHVLETPIRRTPVLDRMNWRAVGVGLTVSLLAAAVLVRPVLSSPRTPAVVASSASTEETPLVKELTGSGFVSTLRKPVPKRQIDFDKVVDDTGPEPTYCGPENPEACVLVDGDGPHVLIVGDSHARMLAPGLMKAAKDHGLKVSGKVIPSCPWESGIFHGLLTDENVERCMNAGKDFYTETVPAIDPDVVVVAKYDRGPNWNGRLVHADGSEVDWPAEQFEAIEQTAEELAANDYTLVMVESVLGTGGWSDEGPDPLDCLARAERVGQCKVVRPPDDAFVDSFLETVAATHENAATVDINPLICPDELICSPVMKGQPIWRNDNHISGATAERISDEFWQLILDTGLVRGAS